MSISPAEQDILYIGVDGGGTKCRVVLTDAEMAVLGTGCGGPSNPYQDMQRAKNSITSAINDAVSSAGLTSEINARLVIGMGLAGVNIESVRNSVVQWDMPFAASFVTTDLHAATIAAHENVEGAVIVIGTGSCGYSCANGKTLSLGGHGFPLGDKGSGAWLGFSAVQAALLAEDQLGESTLLCDILEDHLQASGLKLVERLSKASQSDFGSLAPLVFDAAAKQDAVAISIIQDGAKYLSSMAARLLSIGSPRLSLIGGLSDQMLPYLDAEIVKKIQPALQPPEIGAALFARQSFIKSN